MSEQTTPRSAWGWGLASTHDSGAVLDTWFPQPQLGDPDDSAPHAILRSNRVQDDTRKVVAEIVQTHIDLDAQATSTADAYLRLQLLSHRICKPGEINVDGIEEVLPNVVWTTAGPCHADSFEQTRAALRSLQGGLTVLSVEKFPRMLDYVVPSDVQIGNGARVLLGSYLAPGTVIGMDGYCSYNAGTLGASYVDGWINHGTVIGAGTTIQNRAWVSGSSDSIRTIGANCRIGVRSSIDIELGDDCVVETGVRITPDTPITIDQDTVAARELAGRPGLRFSFSHTADICAGVRQN